MSDSPASILYDADANPVGVVLDGTVYRLQVSSGPDEDRKKLVDVNFYKEGVSATTYYVFIDVSSSAYKHTPGTKVMMTSVGGRALKAVIGSKWAVQLMVVLRIDGTDADLGILPIGSVSLRDTSTFTGGTQVVLFPTVADLSVSGGGFTKITEGMTEKNVTAVNTGVTFKDVLGNNVTPAVGDVLLRAVLVAGVGDLEFAYGAQYWVE